MLEDGPDWGCYVPYEPPPWKHPRWDVQAHFLQSWLNTLLRAAGVGRQVIFDPKGNVMYGRPGVELLRARLMPVPADLPPVQRM
jgi:hypothetical protein